MNRHDIDRAALPGAPERASLQRRLRRLLQSRWPAEGAAHRAGLPAAIAALWQDLADEGFAALGFEPAHGGLREAAIVVEEIGRARCALPMLGHLLGNLVLARGGECGEPLVDDQVRSRLHGGALRMTIAFAGDDAQANGAIDRSAGHASGLLHSVDAALQATHLLACTGDGLLVADLGSPGVSVIGADGSPGASCALVRLEHVAVEMFAFPAGAVADLRLLAQLLLAARERGAARDEFELDLARTASREHDGATDPRGALLEAAGAAVARAAEAFDLGRPSWRDETAAAIALAGTAFAHRPADAVMAS
jgi:hypothetical protein